MVKSGSAATLTPTCFIVTRALAPARAAPIPTSRATFSFGDHSAYTPAYRENSSSISVLGVPGYPEANETPHSYAPLAIASFPDINLFIESNFSFSAKSGHLVSYKGLY